MKKTLYSLFLLCFCGAWLCACGAVPTPTAPTLSTTSAATTPPAESSAAEVVMGYYTGSAASFAALQQFSQVVNLVSVDVYTVDAQGQISGSDAYGAAAYAQAHQIAAYACISNYNDSLYDFDPQRAEIALTSAKGTLIADLVALAQEQGYQGVNIDFENIAASDDVATDRARFSNFIHELAAALHAAGLRLIISVPAKTADDLADSWSGPFDLAALGADADFLQLMTYDEHGGWSAAGPVSGADWVENVLRYTTQIVAPAKLLVGLPAYGYDWSTQGTQDVSWVDVPGLQALPGAVQHWDEASQSPWLEYELDGVAHTLWYEDATSIQIKAALARQYALGGISVWALGKEDEHFWQAALTPSIGD